MRTSNPSVCPPCSKRVSATSRTAVYGPVRTVVWEGKGREAPPYPDQSVLLLHQYFCGEMVFGHELPFDRSSLTGWRQRLLLRWSEELLRAHWRNPFLPRFT